MFKNLSQMKKNLKVGQKVQVINKLKGIVENRIIIQTKTNGFSTGVEITEDEYKEKKGYWMTEMNVIEIDGRYYTKTGMNYEKAKNMKFEGNTVTFLAYEDNRGVMLPSCDFSVGEEWLVMNFID